MLCQKRTMERIVLKGAFSNSDKELYVDMIKEIIPERQVILLKPHSYYESIRDKDSDQWKEFFFPVTIKDSKAFEKIKFEYIRWIKTAPDPQDRVADFEYQTPGELPDFDRLDKLIESRKTRQEKQKEIDEDIELIKECEKRRIDCKDLKQIVKNKLLKKRGE